MVCTIIEGKLPYFKYHRSFRVAEFAVKIAIDSDVVEEESDRARSTHSLTLEYTNPISHYCFLS